MHALLLAPGVDGDDGRVYHHNHAHDEVMLLQDGIGDQGHEVEGLGLLTIELDDDYQQVGPGKDSTGERRKGTTNL